MQSIKENEKAVAEAEKEVAAWKAIVGEKARIEAEKKEAERIAAEKAEEEARVEAERKAEEERKTKEEERNERDENGQPFVVSSDGTTTFGEITEDTGLTVAPIKLSEGVADEKGNGYGLRHIEARHGDQIRKAGFSSVEEFIEQVAKNYDVIKEGSDRNGNKTYRLLLTDKHNNTLMIELSKDGSYWNVNTAGVFKKSYGKDKKEVYNRHTTVKQSAETAETSQADEHSGTQSTSRMNVPTTSADKGSEKPEKKQEKQSVFDKAKEIADKEEKKRKAEAEDDSAIGQATRAVGKKKKVNLFKYTASEKISNLTLRGVHYANGYAYASDGYILFKEKADYPKEWEGTTRDKDGNLIDGKYPDAEKAIPRLVHIPDKEVESLPSKEVLDFAIAASKKLKGEAIPVAIDGLFFNAVNLKKFLEAVASKGMDKVVYRHPMLYATNGKDEIVLMPTVNTLEGALDIADRMESAGLPKEQIDAWKAHIEAADKKKSFDDFKKAVENAKKEGVRPTEPKKKSIDRSVRESRSEKRELTAEERELRDNLVERMRKGGLDVVTDSEEMQRVIDTENERTRNKRSKKSEAARKRDEALYAVDWSTAFVSGKSREEATEIRRERGRKFKEETKELYGRVLSGNFDDVTLRLIDEFIDKSTPNNPYERPISKRLPTRALQKMRGGERTGSVDALFSRICESTVGKDGKTLPRAERERAIEEKKKELLKKWAIATGNWHTDVSDFSDGKEPIGSGTDSDVYLSKDGKSVIKVSKGKPYGKRFRPDVDNVALFNTVFPGSRYTIEGYGEIDGKFVRFLKQPFVDFSDSTPLTEGERVAYMEKLGFKPINKENTAFSNGEIVASDLQKSNVVRDRNGNVRVIDADMKLHTKDVGGNYSYPDVETDTTGLAEREEVNTGSVREHRVYHGSGADFDAFDHSHMGEGEGAQAYGWGTYVTEVEGIGKTYAEQNATKHNDALRALQHDVDAISDQLNRHRDDLKYDEEQLKRANEWRAEAELDYELFRDEAEELKEKYGEASPKYRNHLFNDIYTDEMKRAQSSVKSTEESIQYRKEKIAELEKALKDKQAEIDELPKEFPRHLYTVEIPDDNGSNYLDWNGHPAESLLKDVGSFLESEGFERVQDNPARYDKGESTVVLNPNATGADLYAELQEALGSDKKASQALAELGCIGIKYPADNMRGGRKDGAKNYVIFNENDAKITDHTRFLRTAGGEVYGLVKDGRIYLDPKVATAETAVHEYTHLWGDMLRRKDSEQWSHTVKELKNSVLWEEVKELYPELKTDDEIADEVLSTFSGRRGAERLREEARRVAEGEGGVFTKAKAIETLERVKEAIARFWEGVARMFGINRYRSVEELADMAMKDLINGVKPTSRTFTFDNFYKDTKAVFEGTERPKGKPDYTSYSGSEYWYGEDNVGKYVVRGSDHWSGEFKVKDGERTNVGRNHYSEITEDGMLPIGAQGSLKFGWEKGLSKPVGSGISAAIDRRGSGDSNNIASCYWYIDNAKEKDNKGFTYGKAYLSEFEDKERQRDIPGDDWRDIQGLEGGTRTMVVKKANDRFNEELEMQVKGELEEGHVYKLGMPSEILLSTGVPNLPIELSAKQLSKKAANRGHRFDVKDIANLPQAIQAPIAVFEYGNKDKSQNLIVEIERDGKKFVVGIHFNQNRRGIVVNDIRGLFNKDSHEWLNWISQGKLLYADKEKIQALIDKQRTNLAEVNYLNLDDVAKKVKDFENPKLFGEEIIDDGKKGSDSIERSVRENPKNEDKPRFSRKPGESIFDYASRVSEDVDRSVRERVSARDEYEKKVKSKGFQTKEALQNSMLGLQEFMYAIDHASGNKRYIEDIPDFENPILGENRLSSVNKEEMHQVAKTQFKPLMSAVAKLSGNGKESGELYDYMFAKHGLERDAVMRQREAQKEFDKYQKANHKGTKTIGDFVASLEGKDYAGLTALTAEDGRVKSIQSQIDAIDEQMKATDDQLLLRKLGGQKKRLKVDLLNAARDAADDIRKTFESNPSHDRSDINELWSRVNEVNGNTLRKLYESGMLTKEAYNDISSMYTNYIPMRGFDQTTSADAYAYLTHGDSAFNAPIKTAKGRSSKADNPIAYMQAMAESAIMQGNRNVLVKQKMLNFVRNHPSDLASVSDVWLQYDSVADEWKPFYAFGRESKG